MSLGSGSPALPPGWFLEAEPLPPSGFFSLMELDDELALLRPDFAAVAAGLRYVSDEDTPGIRRTVRGRGFVYCDPQGRRVREEATLARIRALAIPPAWTDVWIAPNGNSHLAATGRDAKGRKQYRYSPEFVQVRDAAKFGHLAAFARVLPRLRRRVATDLARPGMPREKVLATVVALLEATLIRVGNEDYARRNGSFGLTTLRNRHVQVEGAELRFLFRGKGGKTWRVSLHHRRVARVIRACQELPGQHLFQYADETGIQRISSGDVNDYLRDAAGRDVTAKDFRTWAATVEAAAAFRARIAKGRKPTPAQTREVLKEVARKLGNTPAVCRNAMCIRPW